MCRLGQQPRVGRIREVIQPPNSSLGETLVIMTQLNTPEKDFKSYKVTIIKSWFNDEPIVRYCSGTSEVDAIRQVCSWFHITWNLPTTFVKAEINE